MEATFLSQNGYHFKKERKNDVEEESKVMTGSVFQVHAVGEGTCSSVTLALSSLNLQVNNFPFLEKTEHNFVTLTLLVLFVFSTLVSLLRELTSAKWQCCELVQLHCAASQSQHVLTDDVHKLTASGRAIARRECVVLVTLCTCIFTTILK